VQFKDWGYKTHCSANVVGFVKGTPGYDKVLVPWHNCSLHKECVAPTLPAPASTRKNHRQDQVRLIMSLAPP